MIVFQFLLVVVCFLLLAAHFLRAGAVLFMALSFGLLALLPVRRPWAARVLQGWLLLGVVVWVLSGVAFATDRAAQGKPFLRLVAIMGSVAAVTALAALTIQSGRLGRHFGLDQPEEESPPA
jgi:hypothetical protein